MHLRLDEDISVERGNEIFEACARKIVDKRLQTPAIIFLEMNKPLSYIISQTMILSMPALAPIVGIERLSELIRLLRDRKNIDLFISKIEALSAEET